jgi:hypothetical protein
VVINTVDEDLQESNDSDRGLSAGTDGIAGVDSRQGNYRVAAGNESAAGQSSFDHWIIPSCEDLKGIRRRLLVGVEFVFTVERIGRASSRVDQALHTIGRVARASEILAHQPD